MFYCNMRKDEFMNNNFYQTPRQNPVFNRPAIIPSQSTEPPITDFISPTNPTGQIEDQFAENILQKNRGKLATFYMSYSDSLEWRDRIFTGIIEQSGRDYALLSDPNTGKWTLLWTVYLNFVVFDEPVKFD